MPSELYNWDRRDGAGGAGARFRERSFLHHHHHAGYTNYHAAGGGGGGGGGGGPTRWAPDFHNRFVPGHGKQGSRNLYLDEFGHGLMPSRPTEKMPEDDSFRSSGSGRYGSYSREYRGSFVQKDWKARPSEIASQPNGSGKLKSSSDQRSVDVMPSHNSSTPSSDSINSRDQSLSKYQHENNDVGSLGSTGQKLERENSLSSINWKPLKWTRSESLSVRNSGFNHSSRSKSLEPDSSDMKMELMQDNVISVLSPSGVATAALAAETSNAAAEDTNSRKKPRLGWGEGLAKYEKKKVESSDESEKNGATTYGSILEPSHSYASNCSDKSPKLVMVAQCASPATPSSVACSSSSGMEEKQVIKPGSAGHDSAYICNSPRTTQNNADSSFNLEELDLTTNIDLSSSIEELLKSDDSTVDSSFVRSTAMNKLSLLKNNISKAVETAETEIDSLENELKMMISESGRSENIDAPSPVPVVCPKPYDQSGAPNAVLRLAGLHVVVDSNVGSKDDRLELKDMDVDSPGSATSMLVELSLSKDAFPPKMSNEIEVIGNPGLNMSNLEMEPETDQVVEEKPITDGVDSPLICCSSVSSDADSLDIYREDFSRELILASKRNCEQMASEMINKLLPSSGYHFDFSSAVKTSCVQNDLVKERFLRKKYYYKLKEKILTLKFKIFQHLWKEDLHIRSLRKLRGKTQKKFELISRKLCRSYQKYRPSVRSRCSSTAGVSLLASTELLSYAGRLLAKPQIKPLRGVLKMPPMFIDRQERMATRFITCNGLVEDPPAVEKERSKISKSWCKEDEELFIDKLAVFGKDFKKIAISLGHRTTAECVEFYYKNHKSDAFKRAKNKPEFSNHSTMAYMRTSGNRLDLETADVSFKTWGAASAIAEEVDDCVGFQQQHTSNSFLASGRYKMETGRHNLVDRSNSICLYNNERETVAADVLAGICCSLSSEAMSSCITSSLDPGESYQDQKYQIMGTSTIRPMTPEVIQNVVETCSDESCGEMDPTDWTDEEKTLLIQAVASYGKDFTMISRCVRTKTHDQCKVFFSKARKCLGLDKTCLGSENMITDGVKKHRSGACFLEFGSVICNGKSGLRIDEDIASVNQKLAHDPMRVSIASVKPDLHSTQGIVVGGTTQTLISKNLLPDDKVLEDNFELTLDGNDENRNNVAVVSSLDVHVVRRANVENQPNLVETENNAELDFKGTLGNGSGAEVIPDLDVADDVGQVNMKSLPKASETVNICITVDEAKPAVEGCLCKCNSTASGREAKETHDEHPGVHLSSNNFMQPMLESSEKEKPLVLQQPGSALADQGFTISATELGKCLHDDQAVVPEKMRDDECMQSTCKVEQYPIAVSTIKDMSSDISCKTLILEGSNVAQCSGRDFHLQSCHSRKAVSSDAELASACHEGDPSIPVSGSQPYVNKLSTNGDVKLFGQILSKTSQHKANLGSESSRVKCSTSRQAVNAHVKHDPGHIVGLGNLPPRKIGFPDQNRILDGSSTLPDSTILLARYPTAFSNYVPPSSKIEFPSLFGVAKSGECSLNGVSTFSDKDVSVNNGSTDLHMYRNQEMQSLSILAQMQRIKSFDMVPGMQQQSGSMVAINVVGHRGVLGGQFVGVSDPVSAIKMQNTKAEQQQFSGGRLAANIIREDDPWRGKRECR